jgi:hypothetical protein
VKARSRRLSRGLATIAALLLVLGLSVPLCAAAANVKDSKLVDPETAATEALAKKYAPITMLREQQDPPCETSAEQYQPTSVDSVLGNPNVTLTAFIAGKGLIDVKRAPTAADIAGLTGSYYLDINGEALGETCVYAKEFDKRVAEGKAPAVSYAHIAHEQGHSGFALQYWFFWYFNQFNDLHEGDWEGMQVTFEADSPAAALKSGEEPGEIIVFQHAGGERASWGDSKVQKEGSHPIVYPAAGSHATFYDSAVYVQNGQNGSGVGCDNTTEPLRELRPRTILMPEKTPRTGEFEWLSYYGRWGEREEGFNNGPQGPQTKTVWREPFTWMSEQRTTSPRLPGGSVLGPQVAGAFCGAVATASDLINLEIQSRVALIVTLVVFALLIGLFVGFTRWGPIDLERLRARRSFGQLIRTARRLYGRHWLVLLPVAVVAIPIVGGTNFLAGLLGGAHDVAGRTGLNLALADLAEGLARPVASAIVAAIVVVFVRELAAGRQAGFRSAFGGVRQRFWRVVLAQMGATLGVLLLAITIIGIPWAAWKLVGWRFVQQEVLFTDKSIRESFRGSSELVRGRWWHSVRVILFLFLISVVTGPALTVALIFTALPLTLINLFGSLIFALLIPYFALGDTLLYFDLQARQEEEPAKPRRSWRPWRPRQFGRVRTEPVPRPLEA